MAGRSPAAVGGALVAVIAVIVGIVAVFQFTTTEPGFVALVRNGGPLDDKSVRAVIPPAQGVTWTGWFSSVREYPATERFTNVVSGTPGDQLAGDTVDADAYRTGTKDGVDVGIVGQWKFTLNTADDPAAPDDPQRSPLRAFDTAYGQRTYAVLGSPDGARKAPWDGDEGFAAFLASQVRPVQQETMRQVIGDQTCTALVAQCALLNAGNGNAAAAQAALAQAPSNAQTFQKIADDMSRDLLRRINTSLGGPYISDVRFSLTQVTLPSNVQDAIGKAQQQFAAVAEANGRAQQASADASANEAKQRGYNVCTTCADLDRIRAQGEAYKLLPQGITVYAPGNPNVQIPVTAPAR